MSPSLDPRQGADILAKFGHPGCLLFLAAFVVVGLGTALSMCGPDPSQDESTPLPNEVGGLAYENRYDADGNLVPIPGVWHVNNEAGVDACLADLTLEENIQRAELELKDGGEKIVIREIFDDETVGPDFVLERISSSDTEATYWADVSEQTGRDQQMEATFSSSSTWGGRVEGCPDRGAQGSLVEPFD